MSIYPRSIAEKLRSPKFVGRCSSENASGRAASFECGASIRFSISVQPASKIVEQARYETNGCGFVIAAAEDLIKRIHGTLLTELSGKIASIEVCESGARTQCRVMVAEGFRAALADYRIRTIEEFRGETALICTCFGISEDMIADVIATKFVGTVSEVSVACNAGSGCGSCQMLIQEMIDSIADSR